MRSGLIASAISAAVALAVVVVAAATITLAQRVPAAASSHTAVKFQEGPYARNRSAGDAIAAAIADDDVGDPEPTTNEAAILRSAFRLYKYSAIDGLYEKVVSASMEGCPTHVHILKGGKVNSTTDVLTLPMAKVLFDRGAAWSNGQKETALTVVRLTTFRNGSRMAAAGLSSMTAALNASSLATSTLQSLSNTTSDVLIGWTGASAMHSQKSEHNGEFFFFIIANENVILKLENVAGSQWKLPKQVPVIVWSSGTHPTICSLATKERHEPLPSRSPTSVGREPAETDEPAPSDEAEDGPSCNVD